MVGLRCTALGILPPSRKPIFARLKELDPAVTAKARLQPGEAATQTAFVPGNYQVQHRLEVVQIDHTPMGVVAWIMVRANKPLPVNLRKLWSCGGRSLAVRCSTCG